MQIINNIILCFKSDPEFFNKEKSGLKCNTVRHISNIEWSGFTEDDIKAGVYVDIENSETHERFRRKIKDVSTIGQCDKYIIISW